MISESCNPDASVIWGVAFDPNLEDEMRITIVAAGFDQEGETLDVEALEEAAEDVAEEAPKKSGDAIDDFFDNL